MSLLEKKNCRAKRKRKSRTKNLNSTNKKEANKDWRSAWARYKIASHSSNIIHWRKFNTGANQSRPFTYYLTSLLFCNMTLYNLVHFSIDVVDEGDIYTLNQVLEF